MTLGPFLINPLGLAYTVLMLLVVLRPAEHPPTPAWYAYVLRSIWGVGVRRLGLLVLVLGFQFVATIDPAFGPWWFRAGVWQLVGVVLAVVGARLLARDDDWWNGPRRRLSAAKRWVAARFRVQGVPARRPLPA